MSELIADVFIWDGPWLNDRGCARCHHAFTDGPGSGVTQYAAYWYHLCEPDRVCEPCATGRKAYVAADFADDPWSSSRVN